MNVYLGELYKEVEYIQSSGTQYIDTGYIPSNNTKIEMSMGGFNSSTSSNSLFGARYSWNVDASIGRGFGWSVNASTSPYGYGGMFGRRYSSGNDNFNVFNWGDGGNHILSLDQSGFYQDGVKKYTPNTVTFTSPVNLYIFALNDNGTLAERTNYKLYYFKVWNNGTLVRDFIPCYRVSDNVIGLFDKVNNKFYANAGTGSFTKGNDVKVFQPELKNAYIGEYKGIIQTFDFQNNGSLNWTAQTIYGTPSYISGQGWTIGSSSGVYQSAIMPPNSIYRGTLYKVKIWFYKGLATDKYVSAGTGLATSNFTNGLTSWCQLSGTSINSYANIYDGSNHLTQTIDITGEITQEWNLNDDGSITLSLNGGTPYNLGNYATLFRNNRSNNDLGLSIGRWDCSIAPYIRKVEITTY